MLGNFKAILISLFGGVLILFLILLLSDWPLNARDRIEDIYNAEIYEIRIKWIAYADGKDIEGYREPVYKDILSTKDKKMITNFIESLSDITYFDGSRWSILMAGAIGRIILKSDRNKYVITVTGNGFFIDNSKSMNDLFYSRTLASLLREIVSASKEDGLHLFEGLWNNLSKKPEHLR